ncbi:MAG: hypothetical protein AAGF54_19300, partial [Pseudomonadota bacterium]
IQLECIMRVLSKEDCTAAKAYLNWKADDLAEAAGVSIDTLRSFESGRNKTLSASNQTAIASTLEAQGIQFLEDGQVAAWPGVAMKE